MCPVWRCSHAWIFRDFQYVHVHDISNWLTKRNLLLQLVIGPTTKCLDYRIKNKFCLSNLITNELLSTIHFGLHFYSLTFCVPRHNDVPPLEQETRITRKGKWASGNGQRAITKIAHLLLSTVSRLPHKGQSLKKACNSDYKPQAYSTSEGISVHLRTESLQPAVCLYNF